jgi:ATP-dependent phosphofructokinase / diphosphate-dependent phosphofructokinase
MLRRMPRSLKRLGVLTGGGDCPGLNAAIRAVARAAIADCGAEVVGVLDGFKGLLEGRTVGLTYDNVANILTLGGTILGTSRENPFKVKSSRKPDAKTVDRSDEAVESFRKLKLDALICIGGDGTHRKAHKLAGKGLPIVCIPKTIDRDLPETEATIGFDSSLAVATESIDRLHSTAASHHRIMVIEVMGNRAGWLALSAGMAGGGDVILIPEIRYRPEAVARFLTGRVKRGRRFSIVVVAEGTRPAALPKAKSSDEYAGDPVGRVGVTVAKQIHDETGLESRVTVLGYLQRGGHPTAFDRLLATRFGTKAVELAAAGRFGRTVCLKGSEIRSAELDEVAGPPFVVPADHPLVETARRVGTCFGD